MTLPAEQVHSLKRTREFLRSLLISKETPRVPRVVRDEAYSCLRHYPGDYHIDQRWADDVCTHGTDRIFCKKCEGDKE